MLHLSDPSSVISLSDHSQERASSVKDSCASSRPAHITQGHLLTSRCVNVILHTRSLLTKVGFPHSSVGKESACSAGDPSLIPASGRYPGEGIGYPLQYSWASLVAQLVKNLPAVWETWVRSLGWEDPLEKGTATHSSILAWRISWIL